MKSIWFAVLLASVTACGGAGSGISAADSAQPMESAGAAGAPAAGSLRASLAGAGSAGSAAGGAASTGGSAAVAENGGSKQGANVCEPGRSEACACADGATGAQTCDDAGDKWDACSCVNGAAGSASGGAPQFAAGGAAGGGSGGGPDVPMGGSGGAPVSANSSCANSATASWVTYEVPAGRCVWGGNSSWTGTFFCVDVLPETDGVCNSQCGAYVAIKTPPGRQPIRVAILNLSSGPLSMGSSDLNSADYSSVCDHVLSTNNGGIN